MKFPDEYVVRFFFKSGLAEKKPGRVIEFGCGPGHNLKLFADYGWEVTGVEKNLAFGDTAARLFQKNLGNGNFIHFDLTSAEYPEFGKDFDVVLLPSVTYYLGLLGREKLLDTARGLLTRDGFLFLRERLIDDSRFGKGKEIDRNTFCLDIDYTGEKGCSLSFFERAEVENAARRVLGSPSAEIVSLHAQFDNIQDGRVVRNSDLIVWGRR